MGVSRQCTKSGCGAPAVATLTYAYRDQSVVLGPLATYAEPHCYDLCADHASRLTAPLGWDVVRLASDVVPPARVSDDDWLAVADAVRETRIGAAAPGADPALAPADPTAGAHAATGRRRGHLRILPDA